MNLEKKLKSLVQSAVIITFVALALFNDSTQYIFAGVIIALSLELYFRVMNKREKSNSQ
ncbi:hypothetical protein [Alteribacillus bidgolensis]|uniref:Uncharacterized protein n=1 Tax=Alteribacillus bidgolensis TaxID=930129 RepID=A0A1G8NNS7_9BACI|nr:hypothetical protein [Alteribacillus bidgolensis]SDI81854.1 hypothetical protein SAMN05216352_11298 [Alteribacillus bidgolensis]